MDLKFSAEDEAFRQDVRFFIDSCYPSGLREKQQLGSLEREDFLTWHSLVAEKGWAAPDWPREWGGTDWTLCQHYIWEYEMGKANTIPLLPFGLQMAGPLIFTFGNASQMKRFLPGIYSGRDWWCQGITENISYDLEFQAIESHAERQGDFYIVNGTKSWSKFAQYADWMFCLVQTSSGLEPQDSLTLLLLDMKSKGISVRTVPTFDGEEDFCEVVLDNVMVPVENRIGAENKGWRYSTFLLERDARDFSGLGRLTSGVEKLKKIARHIQEDGKPLSEQDAFSGRLSECEIEVQALETTSLRILDLKISGGEVGTLSQMLNLQIREFQQRLAALTLEASGYYAMPHVKNLGENMRPIGPKNAENLAVFYFNHTGSSELGRSNDAQRDLIAKMLIAV